MTPPSVWVHDSRDSQIVSPYRYDRSISRWRRGRLYRHSYHNFVDSEVFLLACFCLLRDDEPDFFSDSAGVSSASRFVRLRFSISSG